VSRFATWTFYVGFANIGKVFRRFLETQVSFFRVVFNRPILLGFLRNIFPGLPRSKMDIEQAQKRFPAVKFGTKVANQKSVEWK
jgi:hypothetical protein